MNRYDATNNRLRRGQLVLLDGAIGTEIVRRGVRWRQHGLRSDADKVQAVHEDYIRAGADVITTDTFQLTRRTYLNLFHNLEHMRRIGAPGLEHQAAELTRRAVAVARNAIATAAVNRPVAIAGSVAPLNHCFRPDLSPPYEEALREHAESVTLLKDAGVDLILFETMNNLSEAKAALQAGRETGLPLWVSFVLAPGGRKILSGEPLGAAARLAEEMGCDALLFNCAPPEDISVGLEELLNRSKIPLGAYAHIGRYDPPSWKFEFHPQFTDTESWPPERYAESAKRWRELGATIIGGCCGTTPAHIRAIRELVR
ncbi:MAG TPA: homocysteine S-methyltransferase family protein [Candidatus Acidoferrales bacterium]|nr:homocysteine S-methyltransferase family protein [Candidatus Acidoferrales bacterium]